MSSKSYLLASVLLLVLASAVWSALPASPGLVLVNSPHYEDVMAGALYAQANGYAYAFVLTPEQGDYYVRFLAGTTRPVRYFQSPDPVAPALQERLAALSQPPVSVQQQSDLAAYFAAQAPASAPVIVVGRADGAEALSAAPLAAALGGTLRFASPSNAAQIVESLKSSGRRVSVYGSIAAALPAASLSGLDVINSGKYADNLVVLERLRARAPLKQVMLSSGMAFEKSLISPQRPVVLVGRTEVPSATLAWLKAAGVERAMVLQGDADISAAVANLKSSAALPVFGLLSEGFSGDAQVQPLTVMALPGPRTTLTLDSVGYDPESKALAVGLSNTGSDAYVSLAAHAPGGEESSSDTLRLEAGDRRTLSIPLEASAPVPGSIVLTVRSASQPAVVEAVDTVSFSALPVLGGSAAPDSASVWVVVNSKDFEDVMAGALYAHARGYNYAFVLTPAQADYLVSFLSSHENPVQYYQSMDAVEPGMKARLEALGRPSIRLREGADLAVYLSSQIGSSAPAVLVGRADGAEAVSVAPYAAYLGGGLYFSDESHAAQALSELKASGRHVVVYGSISKELPSILASDVEVIGSGQRYDDNLAVLSRLYAAQPFQQVVFTSGHAFEKSLVLPQRPAVLVGPTEVSPQLVPWLRKIGLKNGLVLQRDADISVAVAGLKRDLGIPIFGLLSEGFSGNAEVQPLTVMEIPGPRAVVRVESLSYDPASKSFKAGLTNLGNAPVFVRLALSLPDGRTSSSVQERLERGDSRRLSISADADRFVSGGQIPSSILQVGYGTQEQMPESVQSIAYSGIPVMGAPAAPALGDWQLSPPSSSGSSSMGLGLLVVAVAVLLVVVAGGYIYIHRADGEGASASGSDWVPPKAVQPEARGPSSRPAARKAASKPKARAKAPARRRR